MSLLRFKGMHLCRDYLPNFTDYCTNILNGFGKPVVTFCDDKNGLLFSRKKF